jgi:hypothetical protein
VDRYEFADLSELWLTHAFSSALWADLSEGCVEAFLSNKRYRNLNQANGGLIYLDEYFFTIGTNGEARLKVSLWSPLQLNY